MHANRATILVTGPNRAARAFLTDNLAADGHDVLSAPTPAGAWQLLGSTLVDLVVVELGDLHHRDRQGLELVARIRQASRTGARVDPSIPIIVLSPRVGEVERLRVFELGADELILHPYSYPELRARMGALLRRARGDWSAARVRVGPLEVDALARQAWLEGTPVALSGREFALLAMLASQPSRVFPRAELLERVWGYGDATRTRTVDVHASRLRRKLTHPRERFVVNVWGEGYKLVTAVTGASWATEPAVAEPGAVRTLALVGEAGAAA